MPLNDTIKEKRVKYKIQQETVAVSDIMSLTPTSQELVLRTVDAMKNEESENILLLLDESRDLLRNTYQDFKREQDLYRKQLEQISKRKDVMMTRRKENAIPIALFIRQKRDMTGLNDLRPNSGMNTTYQAYFQGLLTSQHNDQQHPTDKAAVVKYIRRRERRRRADENRKNNQLSNGILEQKTVELIEKLDNVDLKLENERQRQTDLLRIKMNDKKLKGNNIIQANEILGQAHQADIARSRVEQTQREKIDARLSAARDRQSRTPTNMIHVQSRSDPTDDDVQQFDDEQKAMTQQSIQMLNENFDYRSIRPITPIDGD